MIWIEVFIDNKNHRTGSYANPKKTNTTNCRPEYLNYTTDKKIDNTFGAWGVWVSPESLKILYPNVISVTII